MVVGADAMQSDAHMLRVIRHTHTKTRSRSHTRWAQPWVGGEAVEEQMSGVSNIYTP
jgi:DNA mismatch repair ATPase MutS